MATTPDVPKKRSRLAIVLAVIVLLALVGFVVDRRTRPRLIAGPMVQIPERGALAITWEAEAFFGGGAVRLKYCADGHLVHAQAERTGNRYTAEVKGDAPGTTYEYEVLNGGFLGREFVLAGPYQTSGAPPRGKPFRFLAFGDSGTGDNSQADLGEVMAQAKPDLVIHTGDLVYPVGSPADYLRNFFEPYATILRSAPFMPVLGNHDCVTGRGQPLLDTFVLPGNAPTTNVPASTKPLDLTGRFYWFDYGDARFVALDSNKAGGEQGSVLTPEEMKTIVAPWLRQVLTGGDAKWKFVYYHHPFYTGAKHSASGVAYLKEAYVDVFEQCGVDMVFCGHNHLYERTAPIRADQVVPDGAGVVYITTGAGGGARYAEELPPPAYMRAWRDEIFSFTQIDVTANRLELRQIGEDGKAFDEYVIVKGAATTQP